MEPSFRYRSLVAVAVLALILSGCGQPAAQTTTAAKPDQHANTQAQEAPAAKPDQHANTHAQEAPAATGNAVATPFEVKTLDGSTFALSAKPARPVAIFFMASWCGTCLAEAQALAKVQEKYGADKLDVLVLDIDPGDTEADLRSFKDAAGLSQHWALDAGAQVTKAYQVQSLDTTLVIGTDGRIRYRDGHVTSFDKLDQVVQQVLQ